MSDQTSRFANLWSLKFKVIFAHLVTGKSLANSSKYDTLGQFWFDSLRRRYNIKQINYKSTANTIHWANVGLTFYQRPRRWHNIITTLAWLSLAESI